MRRRDFLGLVLGASAVWPARALSQQAERVYRIGVLVTSPRTTDINVGFSASRFRPRFNCAPMR